MKFPAHVLVGCNANHNLYGTIEVIDSINKDRQLLSETMVIVNGLFQLIP